jgi:DNA-binding transcriptional MerR regulator
MTTEVSMAFTEEQVARLANVSVSQLRYWDQTGFFKPSLGTENRRLKYSRIYTFVDVVGLRTLSVLLNEYNVSVRYLRKVRDTLSRPQELWADTTLYIIGRKVYLEEPDIDTFREPTSGQLALKKFPMRRVIGEVTEAINKSRERDASRIGHVEAQRFVSRNVQIISGTRIPVATIKAFVEDGFDVDQILSEFPSLTRQDVELLIASDFKGVA